LKNEISFVSLLSIPNNPDYQENTMYAIVKIGGHQYKVSENDVIIVDRNESQVDDKVTIDTVLLAKSASGAVSVGTPTVAGASVEATVLEHLKGDKVIVFKKKRRKGYQKSNGHRQHLTRLRIDKLAF
jgi:large subunit ribosomal protein L21